MGSGLMGLYLYISARCYRMLDKAYAALRIEDWKSFVRIHVRKDGALTIYPVGIHRVPRRWARRTALNGESGLTPDDPDATEPELIEEPIEIPAKVSPKASRSRLGRISWRRLRKLSASSSARE